MANERGQYRCEQSISDFKVHCFQNMYAQHTPVAHDKPHSAIVQQDADFSDKRLICLSKSCHRL